MAKSSKYNRARIRSRVRRPKRRSGSMVWTVTTVVIVVLGVLLVTLTYADRQNNADAAPTIGDHWHAFLGVDVCGTWLPNAPSFEDRADQAGIRGRAALPRRRPDAHPPVRERRGGRQGHRRAVPRLRRVEATAESSFKVWDDKEHKTGDSCGDRLGREEGRGPVDRREVRQALDAARPARATPRTTTRRTATSSRCTCSRRARSSEQPPRADEALTTISDLGGQPVDRVHDHGAGRQHDHLAADRSSTTGARASTGEHDHHHRRESGRPRRGRRAPASVR